MFCRAAKRDPEGVAIRITKRIPTQAGLGGGSADAAAVLRALNRHYDYPFSIYALAELGAEVGSDVPFCTLGGTVLCQGRGRAAAEAAGFAGDPVRGVQTGLSCVNP